MTLLDLSAIPKWLFILSLCTSVVGIGTILKGIIWSITELLKKRLRVCAHDWEWVPSSISEKDFRKLIPERHYAYIDDQICLKCRKIVSSNAEAMKNALIRQERQARACKLAAQIESEKSIGALTKGRLSLTSSGGELSKTSGDET